jgi:putative membrane protein
MRSITALSICVLIAGPVMAESLTEKTGINSLVGISPSTQDFVTEAANSDMFEIKSSQLALQKVSDPATKNFANMMITDHSKTSAALKSLVDGGRVKADVPTALDDSHQAMLDKLKALSGSDFRKEYDEDQVKGHKDAVDLFSRYGNGGKNADLKEWAESTLPTLQHHLTMAEDLDSKGT